MKISLYMLVVCITIFSCKTNTSDSYNYRNYIQASDSITLPFNSSQFTCDVFSESGKSYLFFSTKKLDTFAVYDISSRDLTLHVIRTKASISDYKPVSLDTLLLVTNNNKIIKYSLKDNKYKYYSFNYAPQHLGKNYTIASRKLFYSLEKSDTNYYIYALPSQQSSKYKNPRYYENFDLVFDLSSQVISVKQAIGKYPEYLKDNSYNNIAPYRSIGDSNEVLYSFRTDDSILVYKNGNYDFRYMGSSSFNMPEKTDEKNMTYFEKRKYEIENDSYLSIQYDKFRKKYYRVMAKAVSFENEDGSTNDFFNKSWVIIISDDQFNNLREITFPPKLYNPYLYIVEGGILIFKQNRDDKKKFYYGLFTF